MFFSVGMDYNTVAQAFHFQISLSNIHGLFPGVIEEHAQYREKLFLSQNFFLTNTMLFIDTTPWQVITIIFTALLGIFGVALGTEGFLFRRISPLLRVVSAIGGLTLLYPGAVSDLIGLVLVGGVIAYQKVTANRLAIQQ